MANKKRKNKNKKKKLILLIPIIFFFILAPTSAAMCVANMDGEWNDTAIWDCGHVPTIDEEVTIDPPIIVQIPKYYIAYAYKIWLTHPAILNMSEGSTLTFNDSAGAGFNNGDIGTMGNLYLWGTAANPCKINSTSSNPTEHWLASLGNSATWYAKYSEFNEYGAGNPYQTGIVEWDHVNFTEVNSYVYLNGADNNTYVTNTYIDYRFYIYDFSDTFTYKFENITIDDIFYLRKQSNKVFTNINAFTSLYLAYYDIVNTTFYNFNNIGGSDYIRASNTDEIEVIFYNASINQNVYSIRFFAEGTYYRRMYFENSTFVDYTPVNDWNTITAPNSFVVSKNHNNSLNIWKGSFFEALSGTIRNAFMFNSNDFVELWEGNLTINESESLRNITINNNSKLSVSNSGTLTFGDYANEGFGNVSGYLNVSGGLITSAGSNYWTINVDSAQGYHFGEGCNLSYGNNTGAEIDCSGCTIDNASNMDGGWSCIIVPEINLTNANNTKYPYSICIPINYNFKYSDTCYYTINNGVTNISLDCNKTYTNFDVDFDGNYTLILYGINTQGTTSIGINFEVARPEFTEGRGFLILVIFGIVFLVASGSIAYSFLLGDELKPIKFLLYLGSMIFFLIFIQLVLLGLREYIKSPAVYEIVSVFLLIYTIFLFIFILYYIIYFVVQLIKWLTKKGRIKWRKR